MSNDILVEKGIYGTLDVRQVKQQVAVTQDLMRSVLWEGQHSSSHSALRGLGEPPFIRRATCSDTDCGAMRAGYVFL